MIDYRASISTAAAKTNDGLSKIDEHQEREGQAVLGAGAEAPSAVRINTTTVIKSGEFSSKKRVGSKIETIAISDANQIE